MFDRAAGGFGLAVALLAVLAVFPLWQGSLSELMGAGPDVVSTIWGMWWFQQSEASLLSSTQSTLANYPNGVVGVVLAPSAALSWAWTEPFLGAALALRLAATIQIWGLVAGVCAISFELSQDRWAGLLAGLALCTGRYLYFSIGEASLVAIAAIPLVWGLWGCLRFEKNPRVLSGIGVVLCALWTALENPYLAPILPMVLLVVGLLKAYAKERKQAFALLVTALLALGGLVWVAGLFKGAANPDYPREVAGQWVSLFGRQWEIVDLPWARLSWWTIAWPEPLNWTIGVDDARQASGGRYLGLTVVILGMWGLVQGRHWRWLALGLISYALALGSVHFGLSGLFLFVNGIMDAIARPLTQPTRFVLVLQVVLAVGVGHAAQPLLKKKWQYGAALAAFLLGDALAFGGQALQLPTTKLPQIECHIEGPVLIWPHDAQDGAQSDSQLYQLIHEQPAPHTAIASWAISGDRVLNALRAAGFRLGSPRLQLPRIKQLGYRSIIVVGEVPAWGAAARLEACGPVQVLDLGD